MKCTQTLLAIFNLWLKNIFGSIKVTSPTDTDGDNKFKETNYMKMIIFLKKIYFFQKLFSSQPDY